MFLVLGLMPKGIPNHFNGTLSGLTQFLLTESPLIKKDEKCFLFHLKSSSRSHDI